MHRWIYNIKERQEWMGKKQPIGEMRGYKINWNKNNRAGKWEEIREQYLWDVNLKKGQRIKIYEYKEIYKVNEWPKGDS